MNRYNEHNYRDNDGRNYENRNNRRNEHDDHNLSNYLSRYQDKGNYYGMRDTDHEYRNIRTSRGSDYGNSSSDPMQRSGSNRDAYQSGGSSFGSSNDSRNNKYSSGSNQQERNNSNQNDHYHYGDPNPYMNYDRNTGYERTRGTGWRSESDDSRRGSSDYARQDNSYQYDGSGRRYEDFGRDERHNFGHGEQLTDIHADRGEHTRRRSDNDFGRQQRRNDREDNYATGRYSSNRAYLSEQGRGRDKNMFDHTSDDYPNRSPRGYGLKSGPDWSAHSPIGSDYHRGADRG